MVQNSLGNMVVPGSWVPGSWFLVPSPWFMVMRKVNSAARGLVWNKPSNSDMVSWLMSKLFYPTKDSGIFPGLTRIFGFQARRQEAKISREPSWLGKEGSRGHLPLFLHSQVKSNTPPSCRKMLNFFSYIRHVLSLCIAHL